MTKKTKNRQLFKEQIRVIQSVAASGDTNPSNVTDPNLNVTAGGTVCLFTYTRLLTVTTNHVSSLPFYLVLYC